MLSPFPLVPSFPVHGGWPFYTACRNGIFTILLLNRFCLGMGVLPNHPLVCQLPSHHHLPVLAMPHPITKLRTLFCLLAHHGIPIRIRVNILSHYPLWHALSDSNSSFPLLSGMTFPPKKFEWEPQNRLSPSPHCQTIPSLTSDPWLTIPVLAGYKFVVLEPCAYSTSMCVHMVCLLFMRLPWLKGSSAHSAAYSWLLVAWISL